MKFSSSLLSQKDIGERIFNNSLIKIKVLLKDIFDIDFLNDDLNIKKLDINHDKYTLDITFMYNEREINAMFSFEIDDQDILAEVLRIHEYIEEFIIIKDDYANYKNMFNTVLNTLENKYNLNFTQLDPEENDENIIGINEDIENETLEVIFTHEDHEAVFKASYIHQINIFPPTIKILKHNQHVIFLD